MGRHCKLGGHALCQGETLPTLCVPAQIKLALMERGRLDIVTRCTEACIEMGHTWVAAVMTLELMRKGELGVSLLTVFSHAQDPQELGAVRFATSASVSLGWLEAKTETPRMTHESTLA